MNRFDALELINEDSLHDRAIARSGHSDFGNGDYREGLGVLLSSARHSHRFEAIAERLSSLVIDTLASRLSSQAGWNAHPEVFGTPITAPLIITGLPRSGTTLTFQRADHRARQLQPLGIGVRAEGGRDGPHRCGGSLE